MKKYLARYRANPPDYEATIERARRLRLKVELGGGRRTKGGESPDAQIILNLKEIHSTIMISRTGKILIYYPSRKNLEKCIQILKQSYVSKTEEVDLRCQDPIDPLNRAFEFTIRVNWAGTNMRVAEAKTHLYQWLDSKTGEYIFRLPDQENLVYWLGNDYIFQGCFPIRIIAVDEDDEKGNRRTTAEKLMWKMVKELRRIADEHPRFKPLENKP